VMGESVEIFSFGFWGFHTYTCVIAHYIYTKVTYTKSYIASASGDDVIENCLWTYSGTTI